MTQLVLLKDDGAVKCRKPLSSLVNQTTITGNGEATPFAINETQLAINMAGSGLSAASGEFELNIQSDAPISGKGTAADKLKVAAATPTAVGVVALTAAAEIPANANNDTDALTAAAALKLLKGIKPVGSTEGASAEQNAFGIEVPMLYNVSCNGGTGGSPKFTIPMAGGGSCVVDVGAWGGDTKVPSGTIVASNAAGCVRLPGNGAYLIRFAYDPSESVMYVVNSGYSATEPSFCAHLTTGDRIGCNPTYATGNGDLAGGSFVADYAISQHAVAQCATAAYITNGSVKGTSAITITKV